MMAKVSVVINTLNEETNIARAIKSVSWADEVVVCDMFSDDKTVEIAKKLGAIIYTHKRVGYVEPARNFAISKAKNDWILIVDADEEISPSLAEKLQELLTDQEVSIVEIPRKNIIFGKWIRASMWWPDFNIRFFKKGAVTWKDAIHSVPETRGTKLSLEGREDFAIIHYHYTSIDQYMTRLNRYSTIQAAEVRKTGYQFDWRDLIRKPVGEFLARYFAHQGYQDGLHGLVLSLLQAYSFFIVYVKIWEHEKFTQPSVTLDQVNQEFQNSAKDFDHWQFHSQLSTQPVKRFIQKLKKRVL